MIDPTMKFQKTGGLSLQRMIGVILQQFVRVGFQQRYFAAILSDVSS
jgi:hypothetical protein